MIKHTIFGREHIDQKTIDQFYAAIENPWVVEAALMPDAHLGYAMPIGGVAAVEGAIFPEWIGYDIGCGVCAVKTSFKYDEIISERDDIFKLIYKTIPVGFNHHQHPISTFWLEIPTATQWLKETYAKTKGPFQIGTLGSGNHFIEIGHVRGAIWIVVHSGSRNVGHQTATHYIEIAKQSNCAGALCTDSQDGLDYIQDMIFCLEFALKNRRYIIQQVMEVLWALGLEGDETGEYFINRHHNHATLRELNSRTVWIHRKGATHAEDSMLGIIPGNMRDGSYIVRGKGCRESLFSSSHGAGRTMSRKQAKKELHMIDFQNQMTGITSKIETSTLDESPGAYKDFESVMGLQKDMVEIVDKITPIINIKA